MGFSHNQMYPNPDYWTRITDFVQELNDNVYVYNADCAGFDPLLRDYASLNDTPAYMSTKNSLKEKILILDNQKRLQQENFLRHEIFQAQLLAEEQKKPVTDRKKINTYKHITLLYGATENINAVKIYVQQYPKMLEAGEFDPEDLVNLEKHLADPINFPLPAAKSKRILLVEHWRKIPEIAKRREIARELFNLLYVADPNFHSAKEMLGLDKVKINIKGEHIKTESAMIKDARRYFAGQENLSAEVENVDKLFKAYFYDRANLSNYLSLTSNSAESIEQRTKDVLKAIEFLIEETIDIISQCKRAQPTHKIPADKRELLEISGDEVNWPHSRICHSTQNFTVRQLIKNHIALGIQIEDPEFFVLPYLGEIKLARDYFNYFIDAKIELDVPSHFKDIFEPDQIKELKEIQDYVLHPKPKKKKTYTYPGAPGRPKTTFRPIGDTQSEHPTPKHSPESSPLSKSPDNSTLSSSGPQTSLGRFSMGSVQFITSSPSDSFTPSRSSSTESLGWENGKDMLTPPTSSNNSSRSVSPLRSGAPRDRSENTSLEDSPLSNSTESASFSGTSTPNSKPHPSSPSSSRSSRNSLEEALPPESGEQISSDKPAELVSKENSSNSTHLLFEFLTFNPSKGVVFLAEMDRQKVDYDVLFKALEAAKNRAAIEARRDRRDRKLQPASVEKSQTTPSSESFTPLSKYSVFNTHKNNTPHTPLSNSGTHPKAGFQLHSAS